MTAIPAPTAAPVNALRMWTDGRNIFVEVPGSAGVPCVVFRFPLHEAGLWKALHLLRSHSYEYAGEPYLDTRLAGKPFDPIVATAMANLKSLGVIKK